MDAIYKFLVDLNIIIIAGAVYLVAFRPECLNLPPVPPLGIW